MVGPMLKQTTTAVVVVILLASAIGCVRDVETASAASFNLQSGETWAWLPDKVESWQGYEADARNARIQTHEADVDERRENRELREERRQEPVGPERRAERRMDEELVYDGNAPAIYAGTEGRTLKREHKSDRDIAERLEAEGVPTPSGKGHWHPTTVRRIVLRDFPELREEGPRHRRKS